MNINATQINEIKEAVVQETGVSLADVERILDHLGLDNALDAGCSNVSLTNVRIAAGDVPI
jgi:hypothetical protein